MIKITIKAFGFEQKEIFSNIEFKLSKGMYVLSGVNGVGKSTLINLITGLLKSDIHISANDKQIEPYFNDYIFKANDSLSHFKYFTLSESITYFSLTRGKEIPNIKNWITELKLDEFFNSKVTINDMSRGTVQKCEYLISKIVSSPLVLIDEGLENIDIETRNYIISDILNSAQLDDRCFIIATHDNAIEKRSEKFIRLTRQASSNIVDVQMD